jgi:(R,R)-butanediol dehydrogenase / meso-butanediol dehydrogenase / diacetyl reductase
VRAAVLSDDRSFDVVDVADPTPGPGELVLRIDACGICGSDLAMYKVLPPGTVLGHEFCGEIAAVGTDAESWREGQAVAAMPISACGQCRWCLADEPAHCERVELKGLGGAPGGFAEYVRVDAASAVRLADGIGEHGALVEPLAVGLHTVKVGDLQPGDRVFVIGGGNVGAAASVWASRLGAREVVVSDSAPFRRGTAARFGATGVHDPVADPPPAGFDVVIECVGAPGMVQAAVDAAGVRGRVVIAGVCVVPDQIVPITALMKEVDVRFAAYYRGSEFAAAADLLASGGFDAAAFVSGRVGLDDVNEAFEKLLSTTTERKILVTPC